MKDQILIIGIVVAFAAGYLVGAQGRGGETIYALPRNYDPATAANSEAIKVAERNIKACYDFLAAHLEKQKCEGVAH